MFIYIYIYWLLNILKISTHPILPRYLLIYTFIDLLYHINVSHFSSVRKMNCFSMVEYLASRKCIKNNIPQHKECEKFPKKKYSLLITVLFTLLPTIMVHWNKHAYLEHFYQGTTSRFHILHFFKGRRVSAAFCSDDVQSCAQVFGYCPVVCAPMQRGAKQETKMPWNMIQMMYTSTVSRIRFQKCMSDSEGCTGLLGTRDVLSGLSLDWFIWFYMTSRASSKYIRKS